MKTYGPKFLGMHRCCKAKRMMIIKKPVCVCWISLLTICQSCLWLYCAIYKGPNTQVER